MTAWRDPSTKITSVSTHRFRDARPAEFKDAKRKANEYMNSRHAEAGLGGYERYQGGARGVEKARERVKAWGDTTYRDPTTKHTAVAAHVKTDQRPAEFIAARYDVNAHMNERHEAAGLGYTGGAGTKQTIRDMRTSPAPAPARGYYDGSPAPAPGRGYPEGYRAPQPVPNPAPQPPPPAAQGEEDTNMAEFTCELQRPANRAWGIDLVDAGDALLLVYVDRHVASTPPVQVGDVFIAAMDCAGGEMAEGASAILDLFSRVDTRIQLMVLRGSELGRALVQL